MDSTTVTLGDFVFHEIENAKEEGVTCAHLSSLFKAAEIEIRRCLLDLLGMGLVVQHDNNWKLKRQYEEDEAVSAVQRDIGKLSLGDDEKTHRREVCDQVVPRRQSVERPRRDSSTPEGTLTTVQRGNPPSMTSRSSCPTELASRTRPTSRSSNTLQQSSPSQPRFSKLAAGLLANPSNTAVVYTPREVNLSSVSSSASAPSLPQFQESRTHMAVATRPPTEMICSNPDVQINKNVIGKIAQVLSVANDAMLAKDIAQKSGLGQSRSDVNRWLYFMKERNKVEQVDKRWLLKGKLSPSDIDFMSIELAKINPSKKMKELAKKSPPKNIEADDCDCDNRGPGCNHNHFHQTVENHLHYNTYQFGDDNQINIAAASGNPIPTTEPTGRRS